MFQQRQRGFQPSVGSQGFAKVYLPTPPPPAADPQLRAGGCPAPGPGIDGPLRLVPKHVHEGVGVPYRRSWVRSKALPRQKPQLGWG